MLNQEITSEIVWNYFSKQICEICETCILHCKHSTSTFQCEGSQCENAVELFIDEMNEDDLNKIKLELRKEKINKILNGIQ